MVRYIFYTCAIHFILRSVFTTLANPSSRLLHFRYILSGRWLDCWSVNGRQTFFLDRWPLSLNGVFRVQGWKGRDRRSVDDIFRVNRLALFVKNNTLIIFYHIQKAIENIVFPGSFLHQKNWGQSPRRNKNGRQQEGKSIKLGLIQQKSISGFIQ